VRKWGQASQVQEIADLLEIGSSTVTNVLSRRYKKNEFMIKSSMDKNVKL